MQFAYIALALAPLAGLAVDCLTHVAVSWLMGGGPLRKLLLGFGAGLLPPLAAGAYVLAGSEVDPADAVALLVLGLSTYAALGYGYCAFVNLNMTSLRIRLLQEVHRARDGMPAVEVWRRYGTEEILRRRIDRLTGNGQFVERAGRFYLGKRSFLWIARTVDAARFCVLGSTAVPTRSDAIMGANALPHGSGRSGTAPDTGRWPIDLTLFVACYNEEENIGVTLDELLAALQEVSCSWEIIVIDDASTDRSVELIRQYQSRYADLPIHLHVNERNRGLGHNYREAALRGTGTYYRLICGDNSEPKETFVTVFQQIGAADIIIPYHTLVPGKTAFRLGLSRTYTLLVNLISGHWLRYYNGLAVHRRENILRCTARMEGFGFQADIITRLLDEGATFIQVPVTAQERTKGRSKVLTAKNFVSVGRTLLGLVGRRLQRLGKPSAKRPAAVAGPGAVDLQDVTR